MTGTLGQRLGVTARLGWPYAALAAAGGFLMQALLPMEDAWLAAAVAGGCALVALLLLATGEAAPTDLPPRAQVERWGTAAQFGHAFGTSALALAGFAAGAWLASAFGL